MKLAWWPTPGSQPAVWKSPSQEVCVCIKENGVLVIGQLDSGTLPWEAPGAAEVSWEGFWPPVDASISSRFRPTLVVKGPLHWPLLTTLARSQVETMSPFSVHSPWGHLREGQGWEGGWGEQLGRRRRRKSGCRFSKVSWSMMREGLEISSKCLSWNNWKNTIKGKKRKKNTPRPTSGVEVEERFNS